MIQFSKREVATLRQKALSDPRIVDILKQEVKLVFESPILVPATGIGNWSLYYYCPECSVRLTYARASKKEHQCPSCGTVHTGEPFDSSWWGILNMENYTAVHRMALIYTATGDKAYAHKAAGILLAYAENYPNYEVHGNIPYNGPGRVGAQTLDEANFLRELAISYDLLEDVMSVAEKELARNQMFIPGANFLVGHRHSQIHNHEVITNSAIAVIGLIFQLAELVNFAVYQPYGIIDQLEHGMQENHLWFEGGFGYHFYALTSFFAYEKFALHTEHSHIHHPNYKKMMAVLIPYLQPDDQIPMLNDTNYEHVLRCLQLYEFAYREWGGEKLLFALNILYRTQPRASVESFFYGVETLQPMNITLENYHVPVGSSGNTILRGRDGRYLLIKHDAYGGEHDHYDRLGISYLACGKRISPDLGTTGYGARMHYDYYKNTGSHNTVMIGEENQSPANAVLTRYEVRDDIIYVETECNWRRPYVPLDSFTIVQWQEENYKTVRMRRKIAWLDDYFLEVFLVDGASAALATDWIMHIGGSRQETAESAAAADQFSTKKPLRYLKQVCAVWGLGGSKHSYQDGDVITDLYSFTDPTTKTYLALGPDNPSTSDINYMIERRYAAASMFIHAVETHRGEGKIRGIVVQIEEETVTFRITEEEAIRIVSL